MVRNPYYTGPVTDHFDGTRFFNPDGRPPRGFRDLLRWHRETRAKWPETVELTDGAARPAQRVEGAELRVTMIGHATLLIQTAGLNILTDPVWSERASPFSFLGPKRHCEPGVAFDHLPKIDVVLLTHNHYDHLDLKTLARLKTAHDPLVVTPLGNDTLVRSKVRDMRIEVGDWNDMVESGPARFHFEPCHHWSARGLRDRSMALWAAFTIETADRRIFHVGDTGFDRGRPYDMARVKHGGFDLAILPIGAYEPRWFMQDQHQNPEEAVAGFARLNAAHAIGHHWGAFQLTNEPIEEPVEQLRQALEAEGIAAERFRALRPGQSWDLPRG